MKHYIFQGKLDLEPVNKLLEFITSTEEKILVYVETPGGDNSLTEFLLYYLNLNKDRITLIAGNEITSNGFWLFYYYEGKKLLSSSTFCLIHKSWMEIPSYNLKDRESYTMLRKVEMEKFNKKRLDILAQYLTSKEMKNINKDEDVFLSSERLLKIFNIEKDEN